MLRLCSKVFMQTLFIFFSSFFGQGVDGVVIVFAWICHVCILFIYLNVFLCLQGLRWKEGTLLCLWWVLIFVCVCFEKKKKVCVGGGVFSINGRVCGLSFGYL